MADNVKFIFKTLIKVPIIILVCYLVLNLFAFTITYFKVVGISYVAMQTAVENNFIPQDEMDIITEYMRSLEGPMFTGTSVTCVNENTGSNTKGQYGSRVTVTVSGNYEWVWPLINPNNNDDGNVGGTNVGIGNAMMVEGNMMPDGDNLQNIVIQYTVPGLKYYPDLS